MAIGNAWRLFVLKLRRDLILDGLLISKELLEHLQSPNHITSIKSFDFSTLYTTIPHQKLKSRLATIIRKSFIYKNVNHRYKFLVLGREGPYFVKEHSDSENKYTEDDIINMLEFSSRKHFRGLRGEGFPTHIVPLS